MTKITPKEVLGKVREVLEFPAFWQGDVERALYIFLNILAFHRLGGYLLMGRNPIHEFILFRFAMPLLPFCELELIYTLFFLVILISLEWGWLLKRTRDSRGLPHLTRCPAFYALASTRIFFMLFVTLPKG